MRPTERDRLGLVGKDTGLIAVREDRGADAVRALGAIDDRRSRNEQDGVAGRLVRRTTRAKHALSSKTTYFSLKVFLLNRQ